MIGRRWNAGYVRLNVRPRFDCITSKNVGKNNGTIEMTTGNNGCATSLNSVNNGCNGSELLICNGCRMAE